ncbi:hypothetical protein BGZ72_001625 [Mortierella alpina]|nr:hypothetical protein BGZ72_001625 [Mortierella alpina]
MPLPDANTTHATGPEALDKDYRDAFEAAIEHYIQSFLQMNHPRAEAKIELKDLQQQWTRLCNFVTRLNMASLAHELFTPSLDRVRCVKALEGMRNVFLPEIAQLNDEPRWHTREVFLQLVVITLVLQARHLDSSESVSMVGLLGACDSSIIPDLTMLVNMNITELLNLAERVSSDERKLEALVSDTMVKTIAQMKNLHQTLADPVCVSLVEDLEQTRKKEMTELYRDIPKRMLDVGESEIWLQVINAFKDNQDLDEDQRDISPDPKIQAPLYQPKSNGRKRTPPTIDLDEPIGIDRYGSTWQTERVHGADGEKSMATDSESCSRTIRRHRPSFQLPRLQSFFEGQKAFFFSARSEDVSNCEAGISPQKVIKQLETTGSTRIAPEPYFQRRAVDPNGSQRQSIVVEDEDEDDDDNVYLTDASQPARAGSEFKSDHHGTRAAWWSALPSSSSALKPRTAASPGIAARRRTKHWSKEEEDHLIKYVPFFRYAPQEVHRMKRKMEVRWSDLKDYDIQHGNVLRDRTQVMLKDKFRELKKKGRI